MCKVLVTLLPAVPAAPVYSRGNQADRAAAVSCTSCSVSSQWPSPGVRDVGASFQQLRCTHPLRHIDRSNLQVEIRESGLHATGKRSHGCRSCQKGRLDGGHKQGPAVAMGTEEHRWPGLAEASGHSAARLAQEGALSLYKYQACASTSPGRLQLVARAAKRYRCDTLVCAEACDVLSPDDYSKQAR